MGRKKYIFVQVSDKIFRSDAWSAFSGKMSEDKDVILTRVSSPKAATDRVVEACQGVRHGSFCVYLQWHLGRGDMDFGQVISLETCRGSRDLARFVYSGFNSMILGEGVKDKLNCDYNALEIDRHPGMKELVELHNASGKKCVPVVFRPMSERHKRTNENFNDPGRMRIMGTMLAQQCIRYIERSA
jgi:hypothetical protein